MIDSSEMKDSDIGGLRRLRGSIAVDVRCPQD